MSDAPLLEVEGLRTWFETDRGRFKAVDGISFTVTRGRTVGLVGESGCGKSVTSLSLMGLVPSPPGKVSADAIRFEGQDLLGLSPQARRMMRGNRMSMVFQEPMTSLNPVHTIGRQIIEAIRAHREVSPEAARARAIEVLELVRIPSAAQRLDDFPHHLSGGMRQRVMIAMALACEPDLLIADEPTTALDVTIQAQILELLRGLQRDRGMGIMLITHNLGVVAENADVVCVMYAGRVVEYAPVFELFDRPMHPYTRGLFSSIPGLREARNRLTTVEDVTENPAEFRKLPGADRGVIPWWPHMSTEARPKLANDRDPYCLHQIEPNRWVGCWRTPELEGQASPRPSLDFRRTD